MEDETRNAGLQEQGAEQDVEQKSVRDMDDAALNDRTAYRALVARIAELDRLFSLGEDGESDLVYDALKRRMLNTEAAHPDWVDQTDAVHTHTSIAPASGFSKVVHETPMQSIANSYKAQDIAAFDSRMRELLPPGESQKPIDYQ